MTGGFEEAYRVEAEESIEKHRFPTGRVTPKKAKPKVCLVMIVRDEEAILAERLEAVKGEIDSWCIVDTGSLDETPAVVHEVLDGIPGVLVGHRWAGFADARTFAVRQADIHYPGQWALLLDADTIFRAHPSWRSCLDVAGREFVACDVHHGAIRYSHPRLLKLGAQRWRWRGVLHEYLEVPEGAAGIECASIWVEHGAGGARSKDPRKFEADARVLADAIDEIRSDTSDPGHPDRDLLARYTFYEAQSLRDAGWPAAAEAAYLERTQMGGFFEEVHQAWMNVAALREADGELAGAIEAYLAAWAVDPRRAEPLVGLATIHRVRCQWAPAYAFAWLAYVAVGVEGPVGMFADVNVGWRADFELGVAGWYSGHMFEGRRACERVLDSELAPEGVKATARANLELYP